MKTTASIAISKILKNFNFEKVHQFMSLTKWSWWDGEGPDRVPTIEQLKSQARQMLIDTYNEKCGRQTGGFVTEYYGGKVEDSTECMHLHFSIACYFEMF